MLQGQCDRWGTFRSAFSDWSSIIAIPSRDLFGTSADSCTYNGRTFKQVYENVSMDFFYDSATNTYHYASNETGSRFNGSNRLMASDMDQSASGEDVGFWPFGTREVHFGLAMDFDFYLPSEAYLENNDYYFSFSGDDDLVVYVDGKLALDLGGAHAVQAGYIDFANEVVVYERPILEVQGDAFIASIESSGIPMQKSGFDEVGIEWGRDTLGYVRFSDLGIDLENSADHNFKLAYLERGGGASNLVIEMNMELKANVDYAMVGDTCPDPELTGALPFEAGPLYLYDPYTAKPGVETTDPGYEFCGWFIDEECTIPWVDGTQLTNAQTTFYGKWSYTEPEVVPPDDPEDPAADPPADEPDSEPNAAQPETKGKGSALPKTGDSFKRLFGFAMCGLVAALGTTVLILVSLKHKDRG